MKKELLSAKCVYDALCVRTKLSGCVLFSLQSVMCSLLTLQPHTSWLQVPTSRQTNPPEVTTASGSVHSTVGAIPVQESAVVHCTVSWWIQVVVSVMRGEHHAVLVAECISAGVTRVPSHLQLIVVPLWQYSERTVLGVVPIAVVTWLQVELQLIAVVYCQLTEQVVAEPVVADRIVKTDFKLRPRTIEEVGPVDVLLDQQRDAVGYRTYIINVAIALPIRGQQITGQESLKQ